MNDTGQLLPDNGVDAMTTVSSDRIRIKLKAYDYRILDKAVAESSIRLGIRRGRGRANSSATNINKFNREPLCARGQEVP